ncbi:MAG: transglycosylase domain-containing protein, partial [Pseudomonadota bacterium]
LDPGKTYTRKLKEIMLALKIEQELNKDEILELYLNKIFLGHRAYGVGAAAQVYYGRNIEELTLAQMAMIAGLPQRPSDFNPITNPDKARDRRNHVLWRLRKEGYISQDDMLASQAEPLSAGLHASPIELSAPYVAEMARQRIKQRFGDAAFSAGYKVYTTLDTRLQQAADAALRNSLIGYDRRHGWRGPELQLEMDGLDPGNPDAARAESMLADIPLLGGLTPALVLAVQKKTATVWVRRHGVVTLEWAALSWARKHINTHRVGKKPKRAADVLAAGDVVRVHYVEVTEKVKRKKGRKTVTETRSVERWRLAQLPEIEGAFVALHPKDGAVVALAGGFDFKRSKFNRVTQAYRQPGSSFKPFIYAAALEKGFTAASTVNDAPIVFDDAGLESAWRPENYSGKSFGPTRLRLALTKSRNLVSIRLLRAIGVDYALDQLQRFGINAGRLPRDLSLSLGSGVVRPLDIAAGYSVLANGGFRVNPHVISRIEDADGKTVYVASPRQACRACNVPGPVLVVPDQEPGTGGSEAVGSTIKVSDNATDVPPDPRVRIVIPDDPALAPRTLPAGNAWVMYSMLQDVVRAGTAVRAKVLKRADLAGKTGTTNDQRDAWFSGFSQDLVATAWVGFDRVQPMGRAETGSRAALPMWIDFMGTALKLPEYSEERPPPPPEDMVQVRIDADSGLLASGNTANVMVEYFRPQNAPDRNQALRAASAAASAQKEAKDLSEQIW